MTSTSYSARSSAVNPSVRRRLASPRFSLPHLTHHHNPSHSPQNRELRHILRRRTRRPHHNHRRRRAFALRLDPLRARRRVGRRSVRRLPRRQCGRHAGRKRCARGSTRSPRARKRALEGRCCCRCARQVAEGAALPRRARRLAVGTRGRVHRPPHTVAAQLGSCGIEGTWRRPGRTNRARRDKCRARITEARRF